MQRLSTVALPLPPASIVGLSPALNVLSKEVVMGMIFIMNLNNFIIKMDVNVNRRQQLMSVLQDVLANNGAEQ
ncbi:unnamed protein product [Adineta steineri]|uniref:Uncharacterized protein n=1 Tax=Adineta steineri TaxID=433720 RepID=A0A815VSA1_9BILA|nr:unnamed protein product [Adineta steineri]CAF1655495.1 unnamed protein product [Adineta steineri]